MPQKSKKKKKKSKPSAQEQVGGKVNSGILLNLTCGGMCENKVRVNESIIDEIWDEYSVSDILYEFLENKENGIKQKKWNVIPKEQYKNLLWRFMENPSMARIPRNIVMNWFQNIIIRNTLSISYITELAGHSRWIPIDDINNVFETEFQYNDYEGSSGLLEEIGFYDWCKLPDGSDAWSDYGLEPLWNIVKEYQETMSGEDILILINRCLDVYHHRGDLASAFIEGGHKTCTEISENRKPDFMLGAEPNEISPYYHVVEQKNDENEEVPEKCEVCGGDIMTKISGEPVFVCSKCNKYYGTVPFVNEHVDPNDVDLKSFVIKKGLNPLFWKNNTLDSQVRLKLLDIADDFIDFIGINDSYVDDITITGSIANYNWNKNYSDIDLHLVVDYSLIDENTDFVKDYFNAKKSLWNQEHNILILNYPVEVYVQDLNEPHSSSGVYSLETNDWVKTPNRDELSSSKINKEFIKKVSSSYMNKIDKIEYLFKKVGNDSFKIELIYNKAKKLFDEIKQKRREGFEMSGGKEINNYNIIFKTLRRYGYLDKLYDIINFSYDELNSLKK